VAKSRAVLHLDSDFCTDGNTAVRHRHFDEEIIAALSDFVGMNCFNIRNLDSVRSGYDKTKTQSK